MKNNRKLLVLIVTILIVLVTIVVVILMNKNEQESISNETKKPSKSFSLEQLDANNQEIFMTNYVDIVNGFYFKYPLFVAMDSVSYIVDVHADHGINSELNDIESLIPLNCIMYDEIIVQENFRSEIKLWKGSNAEIKDISTIESNNMKWEKYKVENQQGESEEFYKYIKGEKTFVICFEAISDDHKISKMPDEMWNEIKANKDVIADYIVKSVTFTDDVEYMLNLKEASVLACNNAGAYKEDILIYNLDTKEYVDKMFTIPRVGFIDGVVYIKTDEINIENAMDNFMTKDYIGSPFSTNKKYTIKYESDTMTIKSHEGIDYKVKFYDIENSSFAYVFESEDYIGIIKSSNKGVLDFAIKNISTTEELPIWNVKDFRN